MSWRDKYKVHPAADVFPMMSDEELAALGENIKENGLREPIVLMYASKPVQIGESTFSQDVVLLDGRNRLEAMERAGIRRDDCGDPLRWRMINHSRGPFDFDAASYIISLNIHRRHLTKAQQAELIVAALKASEEYSATLAEKSRDRPKSELKSKACELAAKADISERTVERAIAKANGKTPEEPRAPSAALEIVSDEVEDPAHVLTNILDSIKHAKSVAEAYRKILKASAFDREAEDQICNAIDQLTAKWRTVRSVIVARRRCSKCHGSGVITSKKTGTTVDCDCVRAE